MFDGSALAIGGAVAAVALLYAGVKEVLSFNPKGIFWGAILVGGAVALAGFTGVADSEAASVLGNIIGFALDVVTNAVQAVAGATGISTTMLYLVLGIFLLVALRNGKGKKK